MSHLIAILTDMPKVEHMCNDPPAEVQKLRYLLENMREERKYMIQQHMATVTENKTLLQQIETLRRQVRDVSGSE